MGLAPAPAAVIVTVPAYVPTGKLPAFTNTWTAPGVVPLPGVTVSQLPPLAVAAEALKAKETGVLETVIVCAGPCVNGGAKPPCGSVNVRPAEGAGEPEMLPAYTVSVTGMV